MLTDKKYIDKLLDLYCSGKLGRNSSDIVRGWLLSDDDMEEKEAALARLFEKYLNRSGQASDGYVLESLIRLHDELGFSDKNIRSFEKQKKARRRTFGFIVGGAVAAAVVLFFFVSPGLFNADTMSTTIAADSLHDREVILPDGSIVKLKAGSSVSYDEESFVENRAVEIDGKGVFSVVHDEQRPLVVSAGDLTVKVLGTEFNIEALRSEDTAHVVLRSGKVEVAHGENVVTLAPLHRATIDRTRSTITHSKISHGEILRIWGLNLSFDGVTLHDALDHTGGYFNVKVHVPDDLSAMEGIVLDLEGEATLEEVLFMLQTVTQTFEYLIEKDTVTITKK